MNVLVCVKRVPLTGGKIVLTDDERAISTRHLGFTVSPHEECGAEEAVRLGERRVGGGGDVDGLLVRAVVAGLVVIALARCPAGPGGGRAGRTPGGQTTPPRPDSELERVRLVLPPGSGRQVQVRGHGPEAAP